MSAQKPIHPTLNELTFEIGQVLVRWSFLENAMREHLKRAGLEEQILKGPVISHWRTYIKATYPDRVRELLAPVEKVASIRNFLAHSIYSLHADPWTECSAMITCAAPDGVPHSFSIDDLRLACTDISKLTVSTIRLSAAS